MRIGSIYCIRCAALIAGIFLSSAALAEQRFPAPEFRGGYSMPSVETWSVTARTWPMLDVALLAAALGIGIWMVHRKRSRRWIVGLTIACLLYFGFWRRGCVCPIGATGNVAMAAGGAYALTWVIGLIFLLPILVSLFFGRIFCAGVCPLGAIQDLVLWRAVHIPKWLEHGLGMIPWAYLGLAALVAWAGTDLLICRYDPFVGFFRFAGPSWLLITGGLLLVLSMFIGRSYCRFLCPYGVILRCAAWFSPRRVTIAPTDPQCIDCRLCEKSCPFNAILWPRPRPDARGREAQRRRVMFLLVASIALIVAMALLGRLSAPALARLDPAVALDDRLVAEESGAARGADLRADAYRLQGRSRAEVAQQALAVRSDYAKGSILLGGFLGLVAGVKLLTHGVERQRVGYTADPGACLGCVRCYATCPVPGGPPAAAAAVASGGRIALTVLSGGTP